MNKQRTLYIDIGRVTDPDVAEIYSSRLGRTVNVGDPEFLVMNNLENPSSSADYPTLQLAREAAPDAILSDHVKAWLQDQVVTHSLQLNITVPAGDTLSTIHLFDALEAAVDEAARNPERLMSMLTKVDDPAALQESAANWVIRQMTLPGVVMSQDRLWVALNGEDPGEKFLYEKDAGYGISLGKGSAWCRADLAYGDIVPAMAASDDRVIEVNLDIRPFLETATQDDIETLIAEDWSFSESADCIAYGLENAGDPGAGRLFWYLGLNPGGTGNGQIGFSVEADGEKALEWIEENRPDLYSSLDLTGGSTPTM